MGKLMEGRVEVMNDCSPELENHICGENNCFSIAKKVIKSFVYSFYKYYSENH